MKKYLVEVRRVSTETAVFSIEADNISKVAALLDEQTKAKWPVISPPWVNAIGPVEVTKIAEVG